jgi:hypothetical protein
MALEQELMADAIARGDRTVRFIATNGEENGPYRFDQFALVDVEVRHPAVAMTVEGRTITVRFPVLVEDGDRVELPA